MAGEVRKDPVREFECGGGGGGGEAPEGRARGAAAADGGAYAGDSRAAPPPQPSRSPLAAFLAAEDSVGSDGSSRVLPELVQRTLPPPQTEPPYGTEGSPAGAPPLPSPQAEAAAWVTPTAAPEPEAKRSSPESAKQKESDRPGSLELPAEGAPAEVALSPHAQLSPSAPRALFMFGASSPLRRFMWRLCHSARFEALVNALVVLNCVCLMLRLPTQPDSHPLNKIGAPTEYLFTAVFTAELLVRAVAYGFVLHPGSMLRVDDSAARVWNWLDTLIVLASYVQFFTPAKLLMLRTVRLLKPLRSLSGNVEMQGLVASLSAAMPQLLNVFGLWLFVLVVLSILGMQLWAGKFRYHCVAADPLTNFTTPLPGALPTPDEEDEVCGARVCPAGLVCTNRVWEYAAGVGSMPPGEAPELLGGAFLSNPNSGTTSYDDFAASMVSVMSGFTLEGWEGSYRLTEAAWSEWSLVFWLFTVVFGGLYVVELSVAVLYLCYLKALVAVHGAIEADSSSSPSKQSKVKQLVGDGLGATGSLLTALRRRCARVIAAPAFDRVIMLAILANTACLASEYYGMDEAHERALKDANYFFVAVFALEMMLKQAGIGLREYFRDGLNVFDFFIVVVSFLELGLEDGPKGLSVLRAFRLLRVLKLAKKLKGVRRVITVITSSLKSIFNLMIILMIVMSMLALIGMEIFGGRVCPSDRRCAQTCDAASGGDEAMPPSACALVPSYVEGVGEDDCAGEWLLALPDAQGGQARVVREWVCQDEPVASCDNIYFCLLVTLQLCTGDDWNELMYYFAHDGQVPPWLVALYMVMGMVLLHFLVVNLMLVVVMHNVVMRVDEEANRLKLEAERTQELVEGVMNDEREKLGANFIATTTHRRHMKDLMAQSDMSLTSAMQSSKSVIVSPTVPASAQSFSSRLAKVRSFRSGEMSLGSVSSHGSGSNKGHSGLVLSARSLSSFTEEQGSMKADLVTTLTSERSADIDERMQPASLDGFRASSAASIGISSADSLGDSTSRWTALRNTGVGEVIAQGRQGALAVEQSIGSSMTMSHTQKSLVMSSFRAAVDSTVMLASMTSNDHENSINNDQDPDDPDVDDAMEKLMATWVLPEIYAKIASSGGPTERMHGVYPRSTYSLWLFGPQNWTRNMLHAIVQTSAFNVALTFFIIGSTIVLVMERPLDTTSDRARLLQSIDYVFSAVFILEFVVKHIAFGAFGPKLGPKKTVVARRAASTLGYWNSGWNRLDGVIVLVSVVDIVAANASPGLSAFKAVRALRALRPLRILSKDENMKQVISSIGLILREIANIFLVLTLVWLVFAILGVQLFKGKLSSCGSGGAILDLCAGAGKDTPGYGDLSPIEALAVRERVCLELASEGCAWEGSSCEVSAVVEDLCASRHTAAECLQPVLALADLSYGLIDGEAGVSPTLGVDAPAWVCAWITSRPNFDNVGEALITLFEQASLERWVLLMYQSMRTSPSLEGVSVEGVQNWGAPLYYVAFIIFGALLGANLLVAAVVAQYLRAKQKNDGSALLTKAQHEWLDTTRLWLLTMPSVKLRPPRRASRLRHAVFDLVTSTNFDYAITTCILLSVVLMALQHHDQSDVMASIIVEGNLVLTCIFIIEAALKIFGLNFGQYWRDGWNRFDFFVVAGSTAGVAVRFAANGIDLATAFLRIIRLLRVARALRLVRRVKGIRTLLKTFFLSMPSVYNIGAILLLLLFIFAVLGLHLFGSDQDKPELSELFGSFGRSIFTLCITLTSTEWLDNFHAAREESPVWSVPFFVCFVYVGHFVMINLFVATVLDNYTEASKLEDRAISPYHFELFGLAWSEFDPEATQSIHHSKLLALLNRVPQPLGFEGAELTRKAKQDVIRGFGLPLHVGGRLHYQEVVEAAAFRAVGRALPPKVQDKIDERTIRLYPNLQKMAAPTETLAVTHAAIVIQSNIRGFCARRAKIKTMSAVLTLQRYSRGWLARSRMRNASKNSV